MNEQNSLIFVQNPLEFRCIRRNFRPHFHENFSILRMSGEFRSNFAKISNKFRESFERIAKCSNSKMNENFCFCSHFRLLNEIFAKLIERKFGNPNSVQFRVYIVL